MAPELRPAEFAGYAKVILTLIALVGVFTLGLPTRGLVLACVFVGGAGLWTGLLVFRGTYERELQPHQGDPKHALRRSVLTLCLTVFWVTAVVRGIVEQHWAEVFATFVLWWVGVLAASMIETWRQHRFESSARRRHDA